MNFFDKVDSSYVTGLTDELKVIYLLQKMEQTKKSQLIVTNTLYDANQIFRIFSHVTKDCYLFPMDDFLTSEALAISPELKTNRLETLEQIVQDKPIFVVTNLMGFLRFLPKKDLFLKKHILLKKGMSYDIEALQKNLFDLGYEKETLVNRTGEMAIRGFVVDVFPLGYQNSVRIEFWGDEIESIREFDVNTQLTKKEIEEVLIKPNTEFLVDSEVDSFGLPYHELKNYGEVSNLASYFNQVSVNYFEWDTIQVGYQQLLEEMENYRISNEQENVIYMNSFDDISPFECTYFSTFDSSEKAQNFHSSLLEPFKGTVLDVKNQIMTLSKKYQVIICVSNRYQVNKVLESFGGELFVYTDFDHLVKDKVNVVIQSLDAGFLIDSYCVISERELFNKKEKFSKYRSNFRIGTKIKDFTKLEIGDYVVHQTFGIGRYLGLKTIQKNGYDKDYLYLEYKDSDKLYVPVENIECISKYSSKEGVVVNLSKLGGTEWQKTKIKAQKRASEIAIDLMKLYALREASVGFSYLADDENQIAFEKEFPYEETPDQVKVMEEIKKDMESSHPMDRLLCGDVGYGKTEMAFRAIFKAILSGKQAAFLCPTTILSSQHYRNALKRFESFPVRICLLNRFVSRKQLKQNLLDIQEGKVDLVIGTHRLLSDDVIFKDLGLLVIDEEQRFGVKHKEKIKGMRNNIDILTLSATPIPRTLQMSMSGIRSLSLIETPPINRYPVQTYVLASNVSIIKDAIVKELSRNGQVFILYNHIDDMEDKKRFLESVVPQAKVVIAHGRMEKTELEDVMNSFLNREYDVLLCTTIIETGIDIPSVNTLIIMDADRFGLSQLYQIRGRVGRGENIAYCYLMYDKSKILSDVAVKRLKVIKDFTELGSGFAIAMRDMAIRGSGDLLGSEQAGFVSSVGIDLFLQMLEEEVARIKGEKVEEKKEASQPLLEVSTSISDTYVDDTDLKIEIHKKINTIDSYERLLSVQKELTDRFGTMSEELVIYMYEEWFEAYANRLGIEQVKQGKNSIEIILSRTLTDSINGDVLFMEVSSISRMFRFSMKMNRMIITLDIIKLERHFIFYLIDLLKAIEKSLKGV